MTQVCDSNQNQSNPIRTFMKMLLSTIAVAALLALPLTGMAAGAQNRSTNTMHKVVFEIAMDGAEKWEGALRNVGTSRNRSGQNPPQLKWSHTAKALDCSSPQRRLHIRIEDER